MNSNVETLLEALINEEDVSEFNCKSRIEHYLKKCCCGETCEDMTPKTRVEYLLGELSKKIAEGGSGKLNIHYGLEAPEDITMLWVKMDGEPNKVSIVTELPEGGDNLGGYGETFDATLPIYKYSVSFYNDKYYIFGKDSNTSSCVYTFDILSKTITKLPVIPVVPEFLSITVNNKIYLFGGRNTNVINIFDPIANTTTVSTAILSGVSYLTLSSGCVVGDKAYIFGGKNSQSSSTLGNTDKIHIYDSISDTVTLSSCSTHRSGRQLIVAPVGTKIYCMGGREGGSSASSGYLQIMFLDTLTDTKTTLSKNLPQHMYGCSTGVRNNNIFIFPHTTGEVLGIFNVDNYSFTFINKPTGGTGCTFVGDVYYLFETTSYNAKISAFHISFNLIQNNLLLQENKTKPTFKLMNSEKVEVNSAIGNGFIGNVNNIAEPVKIAVHNGTEWEELN